MISTVDNHLIAIIGLLFGLYFVMLTGEVILWVLTGFRHEINYNLKNAVDDDGLGNRPIFPLEILEILLMFFRPPFVLGTAFWMGMLYFYNWFHR